MTETTRSLVGMSVALCMAAPVAAAPASRTPASPFVRLFDTQGASPAPLSPAAVAKRTGWAVVPENNLAHKFAGDAVFGNDKLAVVLRRKGAGAELYSMTPAGWRRRSLLAPGAAPGDAATACSAIRIVENAGGAVMLEATYRTAGGKLVVGRFRLTTGIAIVEFRAGEGTGRLVIRDQIRHVIVPELLLHDFVFSPDTAKRDRVGIPAENVLLALLDKGEAVGVCVWRSVEQNADAILAGAGKRRAIRACEIECGQGKSVWYGLLVAKGIWHAGAIAADDAGKGAPLDWKPPFAAKWRVDFLGPGAAVLSRDLREVSPPTLQPAPPRPGQRPRRLIVYPVDRSRATPLAAFCPMDVMRNALGVGPCQYVLDMEGLGSEAPATPAQTAAWLERVFRRKRDRREAQAIRERLAAMKHHVRRMDERIGQYHAAVAGMLKLCAAASKSKDRETAAFAEQLRPKPVHPKRLVPEGPALPEELAGRITAMIGKPGAAAKVGELAGELRDLGRHQDRLLAEARQLLRRMRQTCRTLAPQGPEAAEFAAKIRAEIDRMLGKKKAGR